MKTVAVLSFIVFVSGGLLAPTAHADSGEISCRLEFSMKGWSFFYKSADGTGTITCSNGTSANVTLRARGGGLTVGKSETVNGKGKFTEVEKIGDLYGGYAQAEAQAGAGKSATAHVLTKGEVSLSLSGIGEGIGIGVSFGSFVIEPK
jgi:hypothetical protein